MEAANQILETLIRAKNHNKSTSVSSGLSGRTLRPGGPPQAPQDNAALAYPQKPVEGPYGGPSPRRASAEAVSAATNSYIPPQSPTAVAQRQQMPIRTTPTAGPAAAAAAAATGLRSPQQPPGMSFFGLGRQGYDTDTWFCSRYGSPSTAAATAAAAFARAVRPLCVCVLSTASYASATSYAKGRLAIWHAFAATACSGNATAGSCQGRYSYSASQGPDWFGPLQLPRCAW